MQQRVDFPTYFDNMSQELDRLFLKKHIDTIGMWDKLVERTKKEELRDAQHLSVGAAARNIFGVVGAVSGAASGAFNVLHLLERIKQKQPVKKHPDIALVKRILDANHITKDDLNNKIFAVKEPLLQRCVYFKQLLYSVLAMLINDNDLSESIFYYMQDSQWMPLCVAEAIIKHTWEDKNERNMRLYVARCRYMLQDTNTLETWGRNHNKVKKIKHLLFAKKYAIVATAQLLLKLHVFESDGDFTAKCIDDDKFNDKLPLAFYLEDFKCDGSEDETDDDNELTVEEIRAMFQ